MPVNAVEQGHQVCTAHVTSDGVSLANANVNDQVLTIREELAKC